MRDAEDDIIGARESMMVVRLLSAEEWVAEVNRIIAAYRAADPTPRSPLRAHAIAQLRELGLSQGDALRYLNGRRSV